MSTALAKALQKAGLGTHINTLQRGRWNLDGRPNELMTTGWLAERGACGPIVNSPYLAESSTHPERRANCKYVLVSGSARKRGRGDDDDEELPRPPNPLDGNVPLDDAIANVWAYWDPKWPMTQEMVKAGLARLGGDNPMTALEAIGNPGYRLFVESVREIQPGEQIFCEFNHSYFADGDFHDSVRMFETLSKAMTDELVPRYKHLIMSGGDKKSLEEQGGAEHDADGMGVTLKPTPQSLRCVEEWWEQGAIVRVVSLENLLGIMDGYKVAEGADSLCPSLGVTTAWADSWLGIQVAANHGDAGPPRWPVHDKDKQCMGHLVLLIKVARIANVQNSSDDRDVRVREGLERLTMRGGTGGATLRCAHHLIFSEDDLCRVRLLRPVHIPPSQEAPSHNRLGFYSVKNVANFKERVLSALDLPADGV